MSRRSQLALLLIGLAAALLVAWMLAKPDASAELAPAKSTANDVAVEPSVASPVEATERALAAEAVVVPAAIPTSSPVTAPADAPCLAGVLVLADGTPAPPCRLKFEAYLREKEMWVMGSGLFVGTDETGRFAASTPCTGSFVARLESFGGNMQIDGIIDTPATDLRLVVPGYLMRVRVVDVQRRPVEEAAVTAEWLADTIPGRRTPTRLRLNRRTDALGNAYLHLPDPGSLFVYAARGGLASTTDEVSFRDASGLTTHEVVLTEDRRVARFQLVVQTCAEPHVPIRDYCVVFDHFETRIQALRITSEQVPRDGILDELAIGKYRVRLMQRYLGEPAYYADDHKMPGVAFVATDDGIGRLELCTDLGGRIALRVDVPGASAELTAQASILLEDGTPKRPMWFRHADEGGVTVDGSVPVGIERLSEEVLVPGLCVLRVSAKGCLDRDVEVVVRAGEATHVAVELALAR